MCYFSEEGLCLSALLVGESCKYLLLPLPVDPDDLRDDLLPSVCQEYLNGPAVVGVDGAVDIARVLQPPHGPRDGALVDAEAADKCVLGDALLVGEVEESEELP